MRHLAPLLAVALVAVPVGCTGKRELSPEELQQVASLRGESSGLAAEIASAEEKDARYTGGLIKSLIAVRLETLKTTKTLVDQRIHSIESGAPVTVVTAVTVPNAARAAALEAEIARAEEDLRSARREASLYSGGLVAALKASTVATQEQTLAMLKQQYLAAQYGLAVPGIDAEPEAAKPTSRPAADPRPDPDQSQAGDKYLTIVDVGTRVTEKNNTWWKYAWKLTVRNNTDRPQSFTAHIQFQDEDGYVVDDATEHNLLLAAGEENTFTGYELVDAEVAYNVDKVYAKVVSR